VTETNSRSGAELDRAYQEAVRAQDAGDFARAAPLFDMLLGYASEHPTLLLRRGVLARQMGDKAGARRWLEQAAARAPEDAEVHSNLGNALADLGDPAARAVHLRAARLAPHHPGVLLNSAGYLATSDDPASAVAILEVLIAATPNLAIAWGLLGDARLSLGEDDAAVAAMERALALNPRDADRWYNLGNLLCRLGAFGRSARAFRASLDIRPDHPPTLTNLGLALLGTPEALALHERALSLDPDLLVAKMNRAVHHLRWGDAREGWRAYEARHCLPGNAPRGFAQPRWEGEPLGADQPLLLWAEQGVGDFLMKLRYVKPAMARAQRVILETHPGLRTLALRLATDLSEREAGHLTVIERGEPLPPFARHLPTSSLPRYCAEAPITFPYLLPPSDAEARWRRRLPAGSAPKVGLIWAGNPNQANDKLRSRRLEEFADLLGHDGVRFYSLQVGGPRAQIAQAPSALAAVIEDLADHLTDYGETAAALRQLDLLISIDTGALNLAGALNCPAWVIVPPNPCWRWGTEGERTAFYPSLRLFRQLTPDRGDAEPRDAVMTRLSQAFGAWLNAHPLRGATVP
jgi:Tfp pilus assembly protein PilF